MRAGLDTDTSAQRCCLPVRDACLLALLLLLGAVVRLHKLTELPLWYDEVIHLVWCSDLRLDFYFGAIEIVEPFFCLLLYLWQQVHHADFWLRLLSVIAGLGTVALGYPLGRMLGGRNSGLLTSALAALAPLLVFYSRDAKEYALIAFLCAGMLVCAMAFGRPGGRRAHLAAYVLLTFALLHTHLLAPFFVAAINLGFLLAYGRQGKKLLYWVAAQVPAALLYLPFFLAALRYSRAMHGKFFWAPVPDARSLAVSLTNLVLGYAENETLRWTAFALILLLLVIVVLHTRRQWPEFLLLLAVILLPALGLFLYSRLAFNSYYVDRYLIGSSLPLLALCAFALLRIKPLPVALAATLLLAAMMGFSIRDIYANRLSSNWLNHVGVYEAFDHRGIARLIQKHARPGDAVWHTWNQMVPCVRWYSPELAHITVDMGQRQALGEAYRAAASVEYVEPPLVEVEDAARDFERIWLVLPGEGEHLTVSQESNYRWLLARAGAPQSYLVGGPGTLFPPTTLLLFTLAPGGRAAPLAEAQLGYGRLNLCAEMLDDGEASLEIFAPAPLPETAEVQLLEGYDIVPAAAFERLSPGSSPWRLSRYRDWQTSRMALSTVAPADPIGAARVRFTANLPAQPMAVYVEHIAQGEKFPAPTAALRIHMAGETLRVPSRVQGHPGGWAWSCAGCIAPESAGPVHGEIQVEGRWGQIEAHAAFSKLVFVPLETLARIGEGPPLISQQVRVEGETSLSLSHWSTLPHGQIELLVSGPIDTATTGLILMPPLD